MAEHSYLVVTNAHSWGKGSTEVEARKNAFENNYCGRTECDFVTLHFPTDLIKNFWVDDIGTTCWEFKEDIEEPDDFDPLVGEYRRANNGHVFER